MCFYLRLNQGSEREGFAVRLRLSLRSREKKSQESCYWGRTREVVLVLKLAFRGEEHLAGLLGKCNEDEDKNGKALFLVMLSYEEYDKRLLIGTQMLEGIHYVELPDGSRMFVLLLHIDIHLLQFFCC